MKNSFTINSENDIRIAVKFVRSLARSLAFSEVEIHKLIVTVSELTHNILDHTDRSGFFICEDVEKRGITITVQDYGFGIKELDSILNGEISAGKKGLGLGLAGAKRLMDSFLIETSEKGTKIIATKWKNGLSK